MPYIEPGQAQAKLPHDTFREQLNTPSNVMQLGTPSAAGDSGGSSGFTATPSFSGPSSSSSLSDAGTSPGFGGGATPAGGGQGVTDLYGNVGKMTDKAGADIAQLGSDFAAGAGEDRTFESIGGAGILNDAMRLDTPDQDKLDVEAGKGLLTSKYTGPTGLDTTKTTEINANIQQAGAMARELQTGEGIADSLQLSNPGMTPGEARQDAQGHTRSGANTQYRYDAIPGVQAATRAGASLTAEGEKATARAAERTEQEKAIATGSRDYLVSAGDAIEADWAKDAEALNAQNAATAQQFADIQAGGEWGPAASTFRTTQDDQASSSKVAEFSIMQKYPEISWLPSLELTITKRGEEFYMIDGVDIRKALITDPVTGEQRKLTRAERHAAQKRQKELEEQFRPRRENNRKEEGAYANVNPLYWGEDWENPDYRPFMSLDQGMDATRADVASEGERYSFDTINEMLGEAERLEAAGEPFRAAQIIADVDGMQAAADAKLAEMTGTNDEAANRWRKQVHRARRRVKQAKRGVGGVLNSVMEFAAPAVGFAVGGPLGAGVGAAVGKKLKK